MVCCMSMGNDPSTQATLLHTGSEQLYVVTMCQVVQNAIHDLLSHTILPEVA